ncbi:NAD(P)H-dependent glycerol-3-phosphate dehydrogenase [Candidatus Palauibacter sp.]|uniref:NAD(P)H-dependent glycerol-3-phosphate dehydrogenase n=1 Tax=Candidatus Palauibacter sp. TaxID=3101350 RepID=UPI003B01E0B4
MSRHVVAVLGAGSWGTALADVLVRNGHDVRLWARDEAHAAAMREAGINERYLPGIDIARPLSITSDLGAAVEGTQFVVSVCPSHAVREVLGRAAPHLDDQVLVSASKGIEIGTHQRMTEVIVEALGDASGTRTVVLSGPSFAEELLRRLPTAVVAASRQEEHALAVQSLFRNGYFRVYTQPDVDGVELGGALKNVIALGAGISDGLELGSNARAALINRGLAEIARLARHFGARETTLGGLAGLGDLVLTCTGRLSRNRSAGLAIGSGRPPAEVLGEMEQVVEGVRTARAAYELSHQYGVEMPITSAVYSILYEEVAPRAALARLMAREPKPERWG